VDGGAQFIVSASYVGAELQQKTDDGFVAGDDSQLQRRVAVGIFNVEQRHVSVQNGSANFGRLVVSAVVQSGATSTVSETQ
jgi:hypothetical protein